MVSLLPHIFVCVQLATGLVTRSGDSFADARWFPPDVDAYVYVDQGKRVRHALAELPIGTAVADRIGQMPIVEAWRRLAASSGSEPGSLFDTLLGSELAMAFRRTPDGRLDWAAITAIPDAAWEAFARETRLKVNPSRAEIAIRLHPEQSLLFARSSDYLLVSPLDGADTLFEEILTRMERGDQPTLASAEEMAQARSGLSAVGERERGDGAIALFLRHGGDAPGWSAATFDYSGDTCSIRHVSVLQGVGWSDLEGGAYPLDLGLIDRLAAQSLITASLPLRSDFGPFGAFLRAQLPPEVVSDQLRSDIGKNVVIAVAPPSDLRKTACGAMIPLKSAARSAVDFDLAVSGLCDATRRTLDLPPATHQASAPPGEIRSHGVGDLTSRLAAAFDPDGEATLHWTCRDSTGGSWAVVATSEPLTHILLHAGASAEAANPPETVRGLYAVVHARKAEPTLTWAVERLEAMRQNGETARPDSIGLLREAVAFAHAIERVTLSAEASRGRLLTRWRIEFAPAIHSPQ